MKRKRKLNLKKLITRIIFILCLVIGYFIIKYRFFIIRNSTSFVSNIIQSDTNYESINRKINEKYSGIGQKEVNSKDGYKTIFTTNDISSIKTYIEYKQNGNASWSQNSYWDGTMETDGCAITALSIILSGYKKDFTPENLREMYYPYLKAEDISSELSNSFGIENTGFFFDSVHLSNEYLENHLKTNRPILICVWNKPHENRWTSISHYMVLLATDENGSVYVSNPNGLEDSYKASGWYDINEIIPYLAKALFIEE